MCTTQHKFNKCTCGYFPFFNMENLVDNVLIKQRVMKPLNHIRFMTFPQTNVTSATGRKATPIAFICK